MLLLTQRLANPVNYGNRVRKIYRISNQSYDREKISLAEVLVKQTCCTEGGRIEKRGKKRG